MSKTNELKYKPKNKKELKALVSDESINLADIDTSLITNMSKLFKDSERKDFSGINTWDTSRVKNMCSMFENCKNFNQALDFDTSNVTDMGAMFCGCESFNQAINFNISKANIYGLIFRCYAYKQEINFANDTLIKSVYKPKTKEELKALVDNESINLGEIDTSLITDMSRLFYKSKRKNFQGINTWNITNVKDMSYMFYKCKGTYKINFAIFSDVNTKYMFDHSNLDDYIIRN
ncbi:BspA family leucine-rich repeat surface protein [Campylobacter sp. MG1]|uniref:BspA family leucine-rich repeat surface protein n=1 Tax=Campylobacter sp. MG1 TaxID=2976332 RepID=UPI00226CAA16|nr:BspA family leucine-rich repeat surface protein [Campylobacter sp. MG1]